MKLSNLLGGIKLSKEKQEKAIIGFLLGVFFLLIATPVSSFDTAKKSNKKDSNTKNSVSEVSQMEENTQTDAYITALENKLEKTIKGMEGTGKVSVMITLKNNGEKVLEKNLAYESESEKVNEDGKTSEKSMVRNNPETVLIDEGGNTSPLVIMQNCPEIEGVVVVCEGGDNTQVALHIKEAVQALFSIDAHKIVVCKSKNDL